MPTDTRIIPGEITAGGESGTLAIDGITYRLEPVAIDDLPEWRRDRNLAPAPGWPAPLALALAGRWPPHVFYAGHTQGDAT